MTVCEINLTEHVMKGPSFKWRTKTGDWNGYKFIALIPLFFSSSEFWHTVLLVQFFHLAAKPSWVNSLAIGYIIGGLFVWL